MAENRALCGHDHEPEASCTRYLVGLLNGRIVGVLEITQDTTQFRLPLELAELESMRKCLDDLIAVVRARQGRPV